jgi:hypothetical protein
MIHTCSFFIIFALREFILGINGLDATKGMTMEKHKIFAMKFANLYPLYIGKAERKIVQKKKLIKLFAGLLVMTFLDYGIK